MGYAFISYKKENKDKADALRNILIKNNIECWMDEYDIPTGANWAGAINDAVEGCSCLVLVLTEEAQKSSNVDREINLAISNKKAIIPVRFEKFELNSSFKYYLVNCHIETVSVIEETDNRMSKVLEAVKKLVGVKENEKKQQKENAVEKKQIAKEEMSDFLTIVDKFGFKYVGQTKDGKYHGIGIEYYPNGAQKWYEGEWINGKRHGKGIMYYSSGIKTYEGDWLNGKRNGIGIMYDTDGSKSYEGSWYNNKRHGKGIAYYPDGSMWYEGYWVNDERCSFEKWYYDDETNK